MLLFWLLIILFSFLQATVLRVDVITALVLWALLVWQTRKAWVAAWGVGLIADLAAGRELGWLSLFYLIIGLGLWIYRRQYFVFNPLFLFILAAGSISGVGWFMNGSWPWKQALILGLLALLLRGRMMEGQTEGGKLRISN